MSADPSRLTRGSAGGAAGKAPGITVREATVADYPAIAEVTVAAYTAGGHLDDDTGYAAQLADVAGRARDATVLVAEIDARVVGSVTVAEPPSPVAEIAGEGELTFRMLAVHPAAAGRGAGQALLDACLDLGRARGASGVVLCTRPQMTTAHRLYERAGFRRTPERDWEPVDGLVLLVYRLELTARHCPRCGQPAHPEHSAQRRAPTPPALGGDPPRFCPACGRRLVVQVLPDGFRARCTRHGRVGTRSGDQPQPA